MRLYEISDWIESQRQKQAEKLWPEFLNIQVGDLVQTIKWFNDIWAEITYIYRDESHHNSSNITFVVYDKKGTERYTDNVYLGDVRKFAKVDEVKGRLHLKDRLVDPFDGTVQWPNDQPKGYSSTREKLSNISKNT